jgi:murein DD-endopeptidase MepM/ murein hydrolase activator NlpD
VDLAAAPGSKVLAVGDGVIVATEPGLGKVVRKLRLDVPGAWGFGWRHVNAIVYADLGKPLVEPGQRVRKGDPIALVWSHGFVHLAVKEARPGGEVFFDPAEAGFAYRPPTGAEVA